MKIKLSKNQWEFIGKKTGWILNANSKKIIPAEHNKIDENLKIKYSETYAWINKMPNYQSALDIVNNIINRDVSKENAGINKNILEEAKKNIFKMSLNKNNTIEKIFNLDAKVIAGIILIVMEI